MKVVASLLALVVLPLTSSFFVVPAPACTQQQQQQQLARGLVALEAEGGMSRRDAFLKTAGLLSLGLVAGSTGGLPFLPRAGAESLPSGITYEVVENGNGPVPKVGELAAIRFTGAYKGNVFDDLYKTKEPLYFRVGGNTLLKGIEEAVKVMKVGDRWKLTIPGELAFGAKGRSASPGKPRIPPMAAVEYDLTLVALPGRETEILDLDNFDENAPASDDSDPNKGLRF
ncbi:peptidyl-prolyl cis-trans isomerase fkbp16 [Nannochloropsis oceanica]